MECPEEIVHEQIRNLIQRLRVRSTICGGAEEQEQLKRQKVMKSLHPGPKLSIIEDVVFRLHNDYPGDRGIFGPLLLNYLRLSPGECFFMGPNEPHAYISGDCIECMALSDNVVRAGLTPKFKDISTLCNMLHYR